MYKALCVILGYLWVCSKTVYADVHTYYFNAEWIRANPDGLYERSVISFNGSFPLPIIEANKGDQIQLYLRNGLGNTTTSLHFHGIFQNHTNNMDGPVAVTQCPIPPGETMLYNFTLEQSGTYWYHSHSGAQYSDGMRGMVVIHDPEIETKYRFDKELDLTICDWYHDQSEVLTERQLTVYNPTGAEPIPDSSLFNDTRNVTVQVEPETTYLIHIVNMGVMVSQYLFIEDHDMEIIEVDGVYTKPAKTKALYLTVGQRTSVLVRTKKLSDVKKNFCIVQTLDTEMLDVIPKNLQLTSINYLSYGDEYPNSIPDPDFYDVDTYEIFDDFNLKPMVDEPLLPEADHIIHLQLRMENLGNGVNYAFFNNETYVSPKVPTLLTALTAPEELVLNSEIYGHNTNSFVLNAGDVVDMVIDNYDSNKHPLHMHGHQYQLIARSPAYDEPHSFNYENATFPDEPCVRDTIMLNTFGNVVIRFKANNPGVWFFHCHLDFHLEQGLAVVLVEAPDVLRNYITYDTLPDDYMHICKIAGVPTTGNAAGNSDDWLDLTGENLQPDALPPGFTLKGYISLAACILAAFWGLYEVTIFGLEDVRHTFEERVENEKSVIKTLISKLTAECKRLAESGGNHKKLDDVKAMLKELNELDTKFTESQD